VGPIQWPVAVPDLPVGYIGLSLGPRASRSKGPPTNGGTHGVSGRYMII